MDTEANTDLGTTAEDFYAQQSRTRSGVVDIGRRLADLTIPSVFPPENYDNSHDTLAITNQSVNAFLINSLANSLTLSALPPNLPMCKFSPVESKLQEDIRQDPELWGEVQYALSRRVEIHRERLETTAARSAYTHVIKQLLVPGNGLCLWTDINHPLVYNMHSYVVKRDAKGLPIVTVLKDCVSLAVADDDVVQAVQHHRAANKIGNTKSKWEDEADIYHVQKFCKKQDGEGEWLYWQETEGGYVIPGTEFYSPFDSPPMFPAQLIREAGSDWGLGYCSDFEGDLKMMEELAASLGDGAAALAWFLTFVKPDGMTNIRDVEKADNLSVLPGSADDVTVLQAQKGGDLAFVASEAEKIARRLGIAFASEAAIQRSGERVTKEEWVRMSMALEKSMGGLYAYLASSFQRWFVLRFIHLHQEEDPTIKPLPKDVVSIGVATGIDGIARSAEYENLMGWATDASAVLSPQVFGAKVNADDFLRRTAAHRAIKYEGLVKSPDQEAAEKQAAQQEAMQQSLVEKGAGPAVQGGMDMIGQMMQNQGQANEQQQ